MRAGAGTGRQAWLRAMCRKACGFDPRPAHKIGATDWWLFCIMSLLKKASISKGNAYLSFGLISVHSYYAPSMGKITW